MTFCYHSDITKARFMTDQINMTTICEFFMQTYTRILPVIWTLTLLLIKLWTWPFPMKLLSEVTLNPLIKFCEDWLQDMGKVVKHTNSLKL